MSLIVGCIGFFFFPPASSSVVRVVFVFSAIHCSSVPTCVLWTFLKQQQRFGEKKKKQNPARKSDLLLFNRHQHLNKMVEFIGKELLNEPVNGKLFFLVLGIKRCTILVQVNV